MPSIVLTDVQITAGAHTLTPNVLGIVLNYESVSTVESAMGDGTEKNKHTIFRWDGSVTFKNDYAVGAIDEDVFSLIGTVATFTGKPTSGATSTSNPSYSGSALFTGYQPINGNFGELAKATLSFKSAGTLSRLTA